MRPNEHLCIAFSSFRRGCGGLPLTTPKFNILGDPRDTTDAIDAVRAAVGPNAPIFAVGLSAGSAALIRYLGETGENTPVMAAVAISPGHRLPDAWERCHRVYNRILTDKVRRHFLEPNADVLTRLPDGRAALEAGMKASAIREFVERTCVFSGAVTHDDYTRYVRDFFLGGDVCLVSRINVHCFLLWNG